MSAPQLDQELMELLDRIAAHEELALKCLYDLTSSRLYGLALRILGHKDWAEDVLQESYLHVWRGAGDYRASLSPPLAWLGLVVRSRSLDFLRRRRAERLHLHEDFDEMQTSLADLGEQGPQQLAEASEQALVLQQCLQRLEQRQRELVSLSYLRDLSHSELAVQLQLPLGTVKTWIRRGLEQLRQCMARYV
ncbi:sigma-70 family RNA polymerase sigma factor [Comamonas aquatilis]|uniref:RNA polymerase sigma factor n=1 Tax=Comamonas aquatilis TaxID=1778406 RepID=UPI0039EE6F1E